MGLAKSFRDLNVYQAANAEAHRIFEVSRVFPPEERYSLTDQIRRSSRAVNAMIAEAWARRRYEGAFVNKLNEAQAEAMETQSWLDHALKCGYLNKETHKELDASWQAIGGKLQRMIEWSSQFCSPKKVEGAEK
jgi:four helix bundle protein